MSQSIYNANNYSHLLEGCTTVDEDIAIIYENHIKESKRIEKLYSEQFWRQKWLW